MRGQNGDYLYDSTQNALLEFYSKAGSLMNSPEHCLKLFKPALATDTLKATQLAFWLRDVRGGSGVRSGFRTIITWLSFKHQNLVRENIALIVECGRWDDLISLVGTPCEKDALEFWANAIRSKDGLACKWAPRENKKNKIVASKLRKILKMSPKEYRKHIAKYTDVTETKMCNKNWHEIDYNKVPSVAMARLNKAFKKNDTARFEDWQGSLVNPDSGNKVNASTLFPHDVYRVSKSNETLANAQFDALPNYMEDNSLRIMTVADFSGSMTCEAAGNVRAIDVSQSLALYCSDRLGEDNPFYRSYIPFSTDSAIVNWRGQTFSKASKHNYGWYCGSTNIKGALDKILEAAILFNASNDQIPNCLLIISDMQFDQGTSQSGSTTVEACMKKWEKAGYTRPRIVYWNASKYYSGSPATANHKDVALVSGFSPSVLTAILSGEDFTPMAVLNRSIAKYDVIVPENLGEEVQPVKKTKRTTSSSTLGYVQKVIEENRYQYSLAKNGDRKAKNFLLGKILKVSDGNVDAQEAQDILNGTL